MALHWWLWTTIRWWVHHWNLGRVGGSIVKACPKRQGFWGPMKSYRNYIKNHEWSTTGFVCFLPRKNNFHPFLPLSIQLHQHPQGSVPFARGSWWRSTFSPPTELDQTNAGKNHRWILELLGSFKTLISATVHGIQRIPPKNWRMEPENLIFEKGISSSNSFSFWLPWQQLRTRKIHLTNFLFQTDEFKTVPV